MKDQVNVSFKISADEHILLKTTCAQSRLAIKEFMHDAMIKAIKELKKEQFRDMMKESIQQAKEGKLHSRGSFAKYLDDEV